MRGAADAVDVCGRCAGRCVGGRGSAGFYESEEIRFLKDALDEAHGEGRVAAVDVGYVVWVLLVDFIDYESQGFAEVVVVCSCACYGAAASDGEVEGVGSDTRFEEVHFLKGVEGEEVLVAVGMEN